MIGISIKLERTHSDEYCIQEKFEMYFGDGPSITWCSGTDGYYEFNREERRGSVRRLRLTYITQRDTPGGYFLFEIRGKLFL